MLVEYLAFRRVRVVEARNGEEAIDVTRRVRPNVILTGLSMPTLDGWEATRLLKTDQITKKAIIVAATCYAEGAA
jgi:two-component system cell cycle response regulator DivK